MAAQKLVRDAPLWSIAVMSSAVRNVYDHRLRQAIVETGDPDLFPELAIPESTRRTWMRRGTSDVVTLQPRDDDAIRLRARVARLDRRVAVLTAVVRLLVTLVRVGDSSLDRVRVPSAAAKHRLLRAIASAEPTVGRAGALKILGLSEGRVYSWKRRQSLCALDDAPPCPKSSPGRLTLDEPSAMRVMVESDDLKHFSLRSLSLHAKRLGAVFASYGTWCRMVRTRVAPAAASALPSKTQGGSPREPPQ